MRNLTADRRRVWYEHDQYGFEVEPPATIHDLEPSPCDTCGNVAWCSAAYNGEAHECEYWKDASGPADDEAVDESEGGSDGNTEL